MKRLSKRSPLRRAYSPLMVLPSAFFYVLFFVVPTLASFVFAFTDWNAYLEDINFIGFENFKYMFNDRVINLAIQNTLIFGVVTTIGKNLFGLILALILNQGLKTKAFLRSVFYVPAIMSNIVIGLLFTSILHPSGMLNTVLGTIGLGALQHDWLVDQNTIMLTVSVVEIWQWSGFHMLIYLAGLQNIPTDLFEAARIDGAGAPSVLRRITLPLLMPSFSVNVVISLIGGFKVFGQVYALTNGGPGFASQVIGTYVFRAFGYGQWGLATAINLFLFVVIALIAFTVLSALRKREVEY